ncbi:MAG: NAD(P)H-hydrate dehydratase [Caldisericia bacterium]|nr:NAD(P)H-hydrate dehydratase [Caldisericia bacterium]
MKVVTSVQMKEIDLQTTARFGVPSMVLMENAGATVADVAISEFKATRPVIVCGKGGNGGDGFVAARHLAMRGIPCRVFLLGSIEDLAGDAKTNFGILAKGFSGFIELFVGANDRNLNDLSHALQNCDLIIDCLLGTGLTNSPDGYLAQAIELINSVCAQVLSCDIPSGVDGSTGKIPGLAVKADVTCTFGLPKIGHLLFPGALTVGRLMLTNVGFPHVLLTDPEIQTNILTGIEAKALLPKRPINAHKGTFGKVVVVGGSSNYPGAALLSGLGAIKTGAGLTEIIVPETIFSSVACRYPEIIVSPAKATENGIFHPDSIEKIISSCSRASCVVFGPGITRDESLKLILSEILSKVEVPVLIDADALTILAQSPENILMRTEYGLQTIITPHWGEASRFGTVAGELANDPITTVRRFSSRFGTITVLKSARTVIASPKGQVSINITGNTALSKGGSGDVLSGCIAALVAQGLDPYDACCLGCHMLGRAGELVSKDNGEQGVISTEVAMMLPKTMMEAQPNENID